MDLNVMRTRTTLQELLSCVATVGKSTDQIAKDMDISRTALRKYLEYAKSKDLIHISGYICTKKCRPVALFKFGMGNNAVFVPNKTNVYKKRGTYRDTVVPETPRCDLAAAWMLNPVDQEMECQT